VELRDEVLDMGKGHRRILLVDAAVGIGA
jgi:hypothetical protein